jgi:hypothetical protein
MHSGARRSKYTSFIKIFSRMKKNRKEKGQLTERRAPVIIQKSVAFIYEYWVHVDRAYFKRVENLDNLSDAVCIRCSIMTYCFQVFENSRH